MSRTAVEDTLLSWGPQTVTSLSKFLEVSDTTIRRRLYELEEQKKVIKLHRTSRGYSYDLNRQRRIH